MSDCRKQTQTSASRMCLFWHQAVCICRHAFPTWTSKVKYFLRFLMIITRKGSLMPNVFLGSAGHVIYVVLSGADEIERQGRWKRRTSASVGWPELKNRSNINSPDVCPLHLQHQGVDVIVCDSLDVTIPHLWARRNSTRLIWRIHLKCSVDHYYSALRPKSTVSGSIIPKRGPEAYSFIRGWYECNKWARRNTNHINLFVWKDMFNGNTEPSMWNSFENRSI